MKKKTKIKFPKKAKLIMQSGFYKIIPIKEFVMRISLPLQQRVEITPDVMLNAQIFFNSWEMEFGFTRVYRGYAEYSHIQNTKVTTEIKNK